jgi:hypothetical protein
MEEVSSVLEGGVLLIGGSIVGGTSILGRYGYRGETYRWGKSGLGVRKWGWERTSSCQWWMGEKHRTRLAPHRQGSQDVTEIAHWTSPWTFYSWDSTLNPYQNRGLKANKSKWRRKCVNEEEGLRIRGESAWMNPSTHPLFIGHIQFFVF